MRRAVWPDKNRKMSMKVAQKWFHMKNEWFCHLYQNLDKLIVSKGFKKLPKVQYIAQSGHTGAELPDDYIICSIFWPAVYNNEDLPNSKKCTKVD